MGPETLAIASLVGSVASAGVGFLGQMQSSQAASQSAAYNAAVARNNQIVAQQEADRAAVAGATRAQNQDLQNRARFGAIEAAQGASGVGLDSTSSKEVRDSTRLLGRLDTQTVMDNALTEVRAQSARAQSFGEQAQLDTFQASNAQTAGLIGGAGSILGGATGFADKWLKYKNTGVEGFV